jgi:xylulokinase
MYWLGLDVGTGSSRALLIDASGRIRFAYTAPHEEMRMAKPLWAEQDPDDWWRAGQAAIAGVLKEAGSDGNSVRGVGLTGQMHGLVMLNQDGQVIRPALIWCDQRSQRQVDWVNAEIGKDQMLSATANPVLTGFTLPKLLWIRDNEPETYRQIRKIILPKDYLRFRLTGEYATDVSDASGTALFDVVNRKWSDDLANDLKIERSVLPTCYESQQLTGTVHKAAAKATGLNVGTPVMAGAGDQAASAIGNGIVEPGMVSCTIGTSGVVFALLEKPAYDPAGRVHTFCHAIPNAWHVMGVTQGAGLSLQWFRNRLSPGIEYDELTADATLSPPGSQGLFWLPYLMGERTPHLDASARAGWIGLTAKHSRSDLIRSVLEGVCFSQRDGLDIVEHLGARAASVRLSGGGAKSPFWHQLFADIFATRVSILETQEGSAYGAGLLALVGTGEYQSCAEICGKVIKEVSTKSPGENRAKFYDERYQIYRSLYPALKSAFHAISALDE